MLKGNWLYNVLWHLVFECVQTSVALLSDELRSWLSEFGLQIDIIVMPRRVTNKFAVSRLALCCRKVGLYFFF